MKHLKPVGIIFLSLLIMAVFSFAHAEKKTLPEGTVSKPWSFFYSKQCPACKRVEKYLKSHPLPADFPMARKDVLASRRNLNELVAAAKVCRLSTRNIQIPLFTNGALCFSGATEVIFYLQTLEKKQDAKK
ncbi:MAG: hypothetical protein ABIH77_04875 [Pseudomonadota bacterium]|nr:hypothetical protein [Gammaproteobacteria bacterium]MBU1558748.1 hypothetical protein [Gammaproteobacteria bacterium]MBU1629132.1 hypothetical protein [Gammaproteobacteria bacterium]MBU1926647.1 hypothetical protein [Gammaproteobacteria bacterium]MBU2546647.1 hypothetical protein [Gammaproteobacteria bacterium]